MRTDKGSILSKTTSALADQVFSYPDLEPWQKLELERTLSPFDLERAELVHLLSTPFSFDDRTRRWLENYLELSEIYQREGPLPHLEQAMTRWVSWQRTCRSQGRLDLDRERALNRIGFAWNINEARWQKQYDKYLGYRNNQLKTTDSLRA